MPVAQLVLVAVAFALALGEGARSKPSSAARRSTAVTKACVIGAINTEKATCSRRYLRTKEAMPPEICS